MTATIAVGVPIGTDCIGSEIKLRKTAVAALNPNQDPSDPNDDVRVTYTSTIENTGLNSVDMWWLREKLPPDFSYVWSSTTGVTVL